jgi:uncharacterized protein
VTGPHFETICRDWAQSSADDTFGEAPGEVAAGVVADPLRRSQIQVDVAVSRQTIRGALGESCRSASASGPRS